MIALRSLRQAAALTQDGLADLSGVHVRTIRGIESGKITKPRLATLTRIASAIGLSHVEREEFIGAWYSFAQQGRGMRPAFEATRRSSEALDKVIEYNTRSMTIHTLIEVAHISSARQLSSRTMELGIVAKTSRLDQVYLINDTAGEFDARYMKAVGIDNCKIEAVESPPMTSTLSVYRVVLSRALQNGEALILRLRYDYDERGYRRAGQHQRITSWVGRGFFRGETTFGLKVMFHPDAVPRRAAHCYQASPSSTPTIRQELRVDPDRSASILLPQARAGAHLISWTW